MIQTSPLWRNYKLLNFEVCNIVPRVGTSSEPYVHVFWKMAKSEYPDPKTDVAFLRYDKTPRIDPLSWFLTFLLVASFYT